jgi:hypothetical protein
MSPVQCRGLPLEEMRIWACARSSKPRASALPYGAVASERLAVDEEG